MELKNTDGFQINNSEQSSLNNNTGKIEKYLPPISSLNLQCSLTTEIQRKCYDVQNTQNGNQVSHSLSLESKRSINESCKLKHENDKLIIKNKSPCSSARAWVPYYCKDNVDSKICLEKSSKIVASKDNTFIDEPNKEPNNLNEISRRQKPTEIFDEDYLHFGSQHILDSFDTSDDLINNMGKWMMFFKKSNGEFDKMWELCCNLYEEGKLTGIISMKCSTNYDNPTSSDNSMGVIIFYCGPAYDEPKMLDYGKNLLKYIPYCDKYGYMFYKSDQQTLKGTRKTGQTKNSLYRISIPKF